MEHIQKENISKSIVFGDYQSVLMAVGSIQPRKNEVVQFMRRNVMQALQPGRYFVLC